jgi:hypothetical protein
MLFRFFMFFTLSYAVVTTATVSVMLAVATVAAAHRCRCPACWTTLAPLSRCHFAAAVAAIAQLLLSSLTHLPQPLRPTPSPPLAAMSFPPCRRQIAAVAAVLTPP